jgi:glycine cleavage system H protein
MKVLPNLKYTNSDEWVSVDGKIATLGISDYAQSQLSDIVFVEVIASVGDIIAKSDTVATVESVKASADVISPVAGKIVEINEALSGTPEQVNSDPFGAAWLIKVELSNPADLDNLMDAQAYEKYCASRSH